MLTGFAEKAIFTKLKTMYGQSLTATDYQSLTLRRSVGEIAAYLKNETHFSQVLSNVKESMVRRGYLEDLLRRDLFQRFTRLSRYDFSPADKSFYRFCMVYIEVEQLLDYLRYLNAGLSDQFVIALPGFLIHYLRYPILELTKARTLDQAVEKLAGTPYGPLLRSAREQEGALIRNCEQKLYQYYYDGVFQLIGQTFSGKARQQVTELFAAQMDLSNLSTIQRLKMFYHQGKEEITPYLLKNPHSRLSKNAMAALLEAQDHQQVLAALSTTPYRRVDSDVGQLSHSEDQALFGMARRVLRFTTNPAAGFAAFLLLSKQEVHNVINIIEGIRYGLSQEEIQSLLVM